MDPRLRQIAAFLFSFALCSGCRSPYYADQGALLGGVTGAGVGALVGNAVGHTGASALGALLADTMASGLHQTKEVVEEQLEAIGLQAELSGVLSDHGARFDQALLKRFGLFGPPATIFFGDGTEHRALRLIGFEKADDFIARAGKARG